MEKFLDFKNFFSYDECIETLKVKKFYINQSGGRIVKYFDNINFIFNWEYEGLLQ